MTVYKLVTDGTVDELIYEMGERKRQLSQAVLSDERKGKGFGRSPSGKNGASGAAGGNDESEENAISKMLQRALAQRANIAVASEKEVSVPTVSPDSEV